MEEEGVGADVALLPLVNGCSWWGSPFRARESRQSRGGLVYEGRDGEGEEIGWCKVLLSRQRTRAARSFFWQNLAARGSYFPSFFFFPFLFAAAKVSRCRNDPLPLAIGASISVRCRREPPGTTLAYVQQEYQTQSGEAGRRKKKPRWVAARVSISAAPAYSSIEESKNRQEKSQKARN